MLLIEAKPIAIAVVKTKARHQKAIALVSRPNYAKMTIRELKALCKGTGIKGWEKLRKAELVNALSAI